MLLFGDIVVVVEADIVAVNFEIAAILVVELVVVISEIILAFRKVEVVLLVSLVVVVLE